MPAKPLLPLYMLIISQQLLKSQISLSYLQHQARILSRELTSSYSSRTFHLPRSYRQQPAKRWPTEEDPAAIQTVKRSAGMCCTLLVSTEEPTALPSPSSACCSPQMTNLALIFGCEVCISAALTNTIQLDIINESEFK